MASRGGGRNRIKDAQVPVGRQTLPYRIVSGLPVFIGSWVSPPIKAGESKQRSLLESDDIMFWDVRPGLCRDVVPLAHESF